MSRARSEYCGCRLTKGVPLPRSAAHCASTIWLVAEDVDPVRSEGGRLDQRAQRRDSSGITLLVAGIGLGAVSRRTSHTGTHDRMMDTQSLT
jgi:hypothetical protein